MPTLSWTSYSRSGRTTANGLPLRGHWQGSRTTIAIISSTPCTRLQTSFRSWRRSWPGSHRRISAACGVSVPLDHSIRLVSRALRFYSSGRLSTTRALLHDDEITDGARALLCRLQPFSGIGNDRSISSQRLQEHNHLGTVLGRCEPAIRLHVIAGHDLIGCRDEAIELLLVPYKVRALHGAGIAVVLKRTGGLETQKHQECGADQSRDCGAGHDVLLAIERASPHGGLAAARYHTVAPERRCASQQKLRADVALTSFPPSRRLRSPPRADARPTLALTLATAGKPL